MNTLLRDDAKAAFSIFLYGSCSVSIVVVNKLLMTSYGFDFPVFIMAAQMSFTVVLLETLNALGFVTLSAYTFERAKVFLPASTCYAINSILALSALNHMNIALYGVLKRCVPVVTMLLSVIVFGKEWPSRLTISSILMLTIGCIVAGYGDLKFSVYGYTCGALSNIMQAVYLLFVQRSIQGKLSTLESLQLNSYNTLPFLVIFSIINGEVSQIRNLDNYKDISFIIIFFLTLSLGCLLNYALFLCTHLTSALTTSVVGGAKAIVQTIIGLFTFGGVSHNLSTYTGVSISICGGIGYIVAKHNDRHSQDSTDNKKSAINGHIENGTVVRSEKEVAITFTNDQKK